VFERAKKIWNALLDVADGKIERQVDSIEATIALGQQQREVLRKQNAVLRKFVEAQHLRACDASHHFGKPRLHGCAACRVLAECAKIEQLEVERVDA
jgi:hypothetical protein